MKILSILKQKFFDDAEDLLLGEFDNGLVYDSIRKVIKVQKIILFLQYIILMLLVGYIIFDFKLKMPW